MHAVVVFLGSFFDASEIAACNDGGPGISFISNEAACFLNLVQAIIRIRYTTDDQSLLLASDTRAVIRSKVYSGIPFQDSLRVVSCIIDL